MRSFFKICSVVVAALLVMLSVRSCAVTSYLIPSSGMENALYQGERILVNRWSYGLRLPLMGWLGYHRIGQGKVRKNDIVIFNNPANYREKVISNRETYIGRCIGTPGDTLYVDSLFQVLPSEQLSADQKFIYSYEMSREGVVDSLLRVLDIRDNQLLSYTDTTRLRGFSRFEAYLLSQALGGARLLTPVSEPDSVYRRRALIVPAKGTVVTVYPWNMTLLLNTLVLHEHRKAVIRDNRLWVDGKPIQRYRFTQNYHWIVSNNPVNLTDSRLFGLVPETHLIGKATYVWYARKGEKSWRKVQ